MEGTPSHPPRGLITPAAYLTLFLLGGAEGLMGCFQFATSVGNVPVAALGLCALVGVSCLLAGAGMSTPVGGLAVGLGWFCVSFVLTLPTPGGSVIVTDTGAGRWFLYGGALCAGTGIAGGVFWRPRKGRGDTPA